MNHSIISEIITEQRHGRQKYGGDPNKFDHDDSHTDDQWAAYIADHNERARIAPPMERRQHLIKVAGLAISAVESFDRIMGVAEVKTSDQLRYEACDCGYWHEGHLSGCAALEIPIDD